MDSHPMWCSAALYAYLLLAVVDTQQVTPIECGVSTPQGLSLVVNGISSKFGAFPWHVGVYTMVEFSYRQICGGSLISSDLVVSAALCFYNERNRQAEDVANFMIAAGKYYRAYHHNKDAHVVQKSAVSDINFSPNYIGWSGNYANDIALVRLENPFMITALVNLVCMDWNNVYESVQLRDGRMGKIMGWGNIITDNPREELKEINLPLIPQQICSEAVTNESKRFMPRNDKFCAGYLNGSSICSGDRGGGLCFESNGRWYLRGIASRMPSTPYHPCNNNMYTTFTDVGYHLDWIRATYNDSAEFKNPNGCILPDHPEGGSVMLSSCQRPPCNIFPGSRIPLLTILIFKCNRGYTLRGHDRSICYNNMWFPSPPTCVTRSCPVLESNSADIVCWYGGHVIPCESATAPGTRATLACKYSYRIPVDYDEGYRKITCLPDGTWDRPVFKCLPECGRASAHGKTLIANGVRAKHGAFPWHVAIYRKEITGEYDQICGGTLVKPDLVVSAAHCFFSERDHSVQDKNKFMVAAGKFYRSYDHPSEQSVQKSSIRRIHVPRTYWGSERRYELDIALLRLDTWLTMTDFVKPVCVDWDNTNEREIWHGKVGKTVGWGLNAARVSSDELQEVNLPYVPYGDCTSTNHTDLDPLVVADKFCAGYLNGTSVCPGDSGGGLCFKSSSLWFLRGIVSVAVSTNEVDRLCENNYYTVFTNVGSHLTWIRQIYFNEE